MNAFADLKASIKRPQLDVRLCLRADLLVQRERVNSELASETSTPDVSLAGSPRAAALRAQLVTLDELIEAATHTFTFEALTRSAYTALEDKHNISAAGEPSKPFLLDLVAESLTQPDLTPGQVLELLDDLSDGQADALEATAWAVNRASGAVAVPFSDAASAQNPSPEQS